LLSRFSSIRNLSHSKSPTFFLPFAVFSFVIFVVVLPFFTPHQQFPPPPWIHLNFSVQQPPFRSGFLFSSMAAVALRDAIEYPSSFFPLRFSSTPFPLNYVPLPLFWESFFPRNEGTSFGVKEMPVLLPFRSPYWGRSSSQSFSLNSPPSFPFVGLAESSPLE